MNQMHLIVYLESLDCEEVKYNEKKGWYLMRNTKNGKFTSVPTPSNGENLKESTICSICKALDVPSPPLTTSDEMEKLMHWIHEDAKKRIESKK